MEDIVVHGKRYRQGVKKGQKAFYCNYRCFVQRSKGEGRKCTKATQQRHLESQLHTEQNTVRRDRYKSTNTGCHPHRQLPSAESITNIVSARQLQRKIVLPEMATLLAAYRAVAAIFPSWHRSIVAQMPKVCLQLKIGRE